MDVNINQQQIRKIYAIGNALGIVEHGTKDDDLHALVGGITGQSSIKELTYAQANQVIVELRQRQGDYKPTSTRKNATRQTPGGITAAQQKKVWALMYKLQSYDRVPSHAALGDRLCGIIKRQLKIDVLGSDPFRWVNFRQGNRLIEILKNYVDSAEKRKAGVSGE